MITASLSSLQPQYDAPDEFLCRSASVSMAARPPASPQVAEPSQPCSPSHVSVLLGSPGGNYQCYEDRGSAAAAT